MQLYPLVGFQILPLLKFFVRDFSEITKATKLKVHINMDNDWMYCVYRNRGQGSINLLLFELRPLIGVQILPFLKIFISDFSGTMKARKLKVWINIDNGLLYGVYPNGGQGSITLGVRSLGRFSKN